MRFNLPPKKIVFQVFYFISPNFSQEAFVVDLPCVSFYISSRFYNFRRQFAECNKFKMAAAAILNLICRL